MMRASAIVWTVACMLVALRVAEARSDLSCNAMLWSWSDLHVKRGGKTMCMIKVERAKMCGSSVINIVPYQTFLFSWQQDFGKSVAHMSGIRFSAPRAGGGNLVLQYPNAALIESFKNSLQECMLHAVKVGFTTIAITPHMDAPGNQLWRNWLAFSPFASYGGVTYKDAVINPIVSAAKAVLGKGVKVRVALQGEMNMALAMYAKEWALLAKLTKVALGPGAKVGISMNWNKLCGELCSWYPSAMFPQWKKNEFKNLVQSVDFIGVSAYPDVYPSFMHNPNGMDFDASLSQLDSEMRQFIGIGLSWLANTKGIQLQWSEFGMGGGCDDSARCAGKDLKTIASKAYAMVAGPYGRFENPWTQQWARDFRYRFHQQALRKLNQGTGRFPISYAFLWATGSMDFCGVDPTSSNSKGTFKSESICTMVNNYNSKRIVP